MEFAKLRSASRYNLATSGMPAYPLKKLVGSIDELEINGPSIYGYAALNEAIATRYRVSVESVVHAAGTSMANYLAMAAVTENGDEVLIEEPTYELLLSTARYLGLKVRRFRRASEDSFAIDLDDLARSITSSTKLIVVCNLHNPSGAFVDKATMRAVGEIARRHGAKVLVDEVYREMMWEQPPHTAFHLDPETFISTNSLTKAYGLSGLRCGWVLASAEVAERIWKINDLHAATSPHIAELLSVIALQKLEQIIAEQRELLTRNRGLLRRFLESRDDLDYFWPEDGTVVFPRWKGGDIARLCASLRERFETTVVPGSYFEMPDRFRIGVGIATAALEASLLQLGKGLGNVRE